MTPAGTMAAKIDDEPYGRKPSGKAKKFFAWNMNANTKIIVSMIAAILNHVMIALDFPNMFTPTYWIIINIARSASARITPAGVRSDIEEL
jgi:hypothetical protein